MLIAAVVCIFVMAFAWWWYSSEEDPLAKVSGPPKLPIIGNAHLMMKIKPENFLQEISEFTKKYGYRYKISVFNVRVLHIVDPADMEVIMSHSKNIKKSFIYQFLKGWLGDGLLLSSGAHWHKRRKILTPTFHFNILKNFALVMEEKTHDLVQLLKDKNGADVDIMPVISDYTLYTICETAMGTKLDKDQSAAAVEYKKSILSIGYLLISRVLNFWKWNDFFFKLFSEGKEFSRILETALSFADNVILERKAKRKEMKIDEVIDEDYGTKKRMAMLDLLLEAESKGEIDLKGIRDDVNTFMFEGHDTTAMAITFGVMLLADHDDIQDHIFEEVKSVLGSSDRTLSLSDLPELKYLEAVIKEILRLYPSVPFIGRQAVEDFMLGDLLVKKGTVTDLHIYEMHRREDLFPDAQAFKPERFLGATEMKNPYSYVPFSAGPRNCIGQRFAMQEMKCAFGEIVRNFRLVPKVKGARPEVMSDMVIRPVNPIYVKFIPR